MTTFDEIRQRARQALGADDTGRIDQEQARVQRARQEARRQARQERTQQRVEEAREQERQRVLTGADDQGIIASITSTVDAAADAVADNDNERLDDFRSALNTDFDGDGEALADEFGLQSSGRADVEDQLFGQLDTITGENAGRLDSVESDLDRMPGESVPGRGRRAAAGRRDAGPGRTLDLDVDPGELDDDILGDLE